MGSQNTSNYSRHQLTNNTDESKHK